jgi:hypothetical protein
MQMHVLYQQSTLGVSISFRIVHLEMMSSTPSGLDSSGGEATKYLKSFCKYAGDKNEKGGQWDHALLLTGYDLKEGRDSLVAGMAWFSTMCLRVSVTICPWRKINNSILYPNNLIDKR